MKVDEVTDVIVLENDELELRHELLDHSGISKEEIPSIGMRFNSLSLTQKFYANYTKKFGFVTKVENTNFDKTKKKSKIPINQSIHYNREGYRKSRVHYHEYRELTMHDKCVITDNNETIIRPNKTYVALANEKEPEDDVVDLKGVIPCVSSTTIERQFQRKYTRNIFRDVQLELRKKADCVVRSIEHQGDSIYVKVDEQKIVWEKNVYRTFIVDFDPLTHEVRCKCNIFESTSILCCHTLIVLSYYRVDRVLSCYVLPRWSKNIMRKDTYIRSSHDVARSDESHNLFRHLCLEFYNVA
ncbi:hypothetical protein Ahy_A10g050000 [Arachis hypogaea]|uniref:Protein FAR1-RELATED SEQUENCE n=1 Tax=Arachis hypogaea TaxID=3818 RepID=A0A445B8E2_ARAHY|nr:hypothetical protein Ahy_A10g050000 [Arachis hypogaea]